MTKATAVIIQQISVMAIFFVSVARCAGKVPPLRGVDGLHRLWALALRLIAPLFMAAARISVAPRVCMAVAPPCRHPAPPPFVCAARLLAGSPRRRLHLDCRRHQR